jgi:hypothetical protein
MAYVSWKHAISATRSELKAIAPVRSAALIFPNRKDLHRLATGGYGLATDGYDSAALDPSNGFCCAIILLRHRFPKAPRRGFGPEPVAPTLPCIVRF